jgi:uncharacterized delta-60 repeat protein
MAGIIRGKTIIGKPQIFKYYICGQFTSYNSDGIANYVARLNYDGSLDTTFNTTNTGAGFNSPVNAIALDNNSKLIVGGDFTDFNSLSFSAPYIARLNQDGSLDGTFNIGSGFDSYVYTIAVDSKNRIYVGGNFSTYNGTTSGKIARLLPDGSYDTTFNVGGGFNGRVRSVVVQPDGTVLVGGEFTDYDSNSVYYFVKLDEDGRFNSGFPQYTTSGLDNAVYTIKSLPDGKIFVGGSFLNYDTVHYGGIIGFKQDGSIDNTFNVIGGFNNTVRSIDYNGRVLAGGDFTLYQTSLGYTSTNYLIKLNQDATINMTYSEPNNIVYSVLCDLTKTLIGGNFNRAGRNYLTRLENDGNPDLTFNNGGSGPSSTVSSIIKIAI